MSLLLEAFCDDSISHLDDGDYTRTNADVLNSPLHHTLPRFEHNLDE